MRRLRAGMVGGGLDALVGGWHRRAMALEDRIELVAGDVRGVLTASQILQGAGNGLAIAVYGTRGAVCRHQERPETLTVARNGAPRRIYRRGESYLCTSAKRTTHLPVGHPEGFNEAFANLYANVGDTIRARREGRSPTELELDFPNARDGVRGMAFVEAAVDSDAAAAKWTRMAPYLS